MSPHPTLSITPSGATSPDMSLSLPLVIKFPLNNSVWMITHTKLQCFTPFSVSLLPSVHILYNMGSILLLENLLRQLVIFQKNIRGNTPTNLLDRDSISQQNNCILSLDGFYFSNWEYFQSLVRTIVFFKKASEPNPCQHATFFIQLNQSLHSCNRYFSCINIFHCIIKWRFGIDPNILIVPFCW